MKSVLATSIASTLLAGVVAISLAAPSSAATTRKVIVHTRPHVAVVHVTRHPMEVVTHHRHHSRHHRHHHYANHTIVRRTAVVHPMGRHEIVSHTTIVRPLARHATVTHTKIVHPNAHTTKVIVHKTHA